MYSFSLERKSGSEKMNQWMEEKTINEMGGQKPQLSRACIRVMEGMRMRGLQYMMECKD